MKHCTTTTHHTGPTSGTKVFSLRHVLELHILLLLQILSESQVQQFELVQVAVHSPKDIDSNLHVRPVYNTFLNCRTFHTNAIDCGGFVCQVSVCTSVL